MAFNTPKKDSTQPATVAKTETHNQSLKAETNDMRVKMLARRS
jgi:hypothetical protein